MASQLQRLESSFSVFAQESNPNQLLAHLGRMAVEFHTLSSKVQKNEQRTSLLQVELTALSHTHTTTLFTVIQHVDLFPASFYYRHRFYSNRSSAGTSYTVLCT